MRLRGSPRSGGGDGGKAGCISDYFTSNILHMQILTFLCLQWKFMTTHLFFRLVQHFLLQPSDYFTYHQVLTFNNSAWCSYWVYIAHLRQECHNSKFGIFELLV